MSGPQQESVYGVIVDADHPLNSIAAEAHRIAREHGWWDEERAMSEIVANIHDEVSEAWRAWVHGQDKHTYEVYVDPNKPVPSEGEAYEALRALQHWANAATMEGGDTVDSEPPVGVMDTLVKAGIAKPVGLDVELIDTIIRCLDALHKRGVNIDAMLAEKMAFNNQREYRHGGKRA